MKTIIVNQYGGPEVLRLTETETPLPQPGSILVKLHAAGVNPVDTYLRTGTQGYAPSLPWTPGIDGAGTVEAVGEGIDPSEVPPIGSAVYTMGSITGTYSDYCLCLPSQIYQLPEELNFQQGACLGIPYFTAARALFTLGKFREGENLLIHGATGGVGIAALQLTANMKGRRIGTAGSEQGRQLVEKFGATCFNHHDTNHFSSITEHLGAPVNLVLEMLADVNLQNDLEILSLHGRVMVVGCRGSIEIAPRDLMKTESLVMGVKVLLTTPEESQQYAKIIAKGAKDGTIQPPIAKVYPLEEVAQAHRKVMEGAHIGNIILSMD